jgi:hypothetical protein
MSETLDSNETVKAHALGCILLCLGLGLTPTLATAQQPMLELSAGVHRIEAEVASTWSSRAEGLMHRRQLGAGRGMLFVFPDPARHCMWMRNTHIPLSVAFVDDAGEIINIAEMEPESEVNHCAGKPAKYALEMNAGWFKQRGIAAGQRIGGIERAPAAH